jgi:hypothetical protein
VDRSDVSLSAGTEQASVQEPPSGKENLTYEDLLNLLAALWVGTLTTRVRNSGGSRVDLRREIEAAFREISESPAMIYGGEAKAPPDNA